MKDRDQIIMEHYGISDLQTVIDENELKEMTDYIPLLAPLMASGIVMTSLYLQIRREKKKRKAKCKELGGDSLKRCLINVDIQTIQNQITATSKANCGKHKNPEKCRKRIAGIIADFKVEIQKKKNKLAAI